MSPQLHPMSFEPRGRHHETLRTQALDSAVSLALEGGVGSSLGGASSGSAAIFVGSSARSVPPAVRAAQAVAKARDEERETKRREDGEEPDYAADAEAVRRAYEERVRAFGTKLGASVSLRERQELNKVDDHSLLYGEISFKTLHYCLRKIALWHGVPGRGSTPRSGVMQPGGGVGVGGHFYDLGSGLGKACILACLTHPFETVTGLEVLEGLHVAGLELLSACLDAKSPTAASMPCMDVELIRGDFTDRDTCDWSRADVVLLHGASFSEDLMAKIARLCEDLKVGSFVLAVSKTVPFRGLSIVDEVRGEFTWGEGTVFIMQRQAEEAEVHEEANNDD